MSGSQKPETFEFVPAGPWQTPIESVLSSLIPNFEVVTPQDYPPCRKLVADRNGSLGVEMAATSRLAIYFHVHLVSDSTGETLNAISKAVCARFDGILPIEHIYPLVRSARQLERVLREIEDGPGMVVHTIVDRDLRTMLEDGCRRLMTPCIGALDPLTAALGRYLGAQLSTRVGAQHALDTDYFNRIEALNYAIGHDDGQGGQNLESADVVLVGVSRTSKTPTSIYLAHRGVRAANVPIVPGAALPDQLFKLTRPLVVGLILSPDRLIQIRRNRLLSLNEMRESSYVDSEAVREEIVQARRLFERYGWPVIDVSRRSVEETAAAVINLLNARQPARVPTSTDSAP